MSKTKKLELERIDVMVEVSQKMKIRRPRIWAKHDVKSASELVRKAIDNLLNTKK